MPPASSSRKSTPSNVQRRREQNRRAQQLHRAKRANYLEELEKRCALSATETNSLVSEIEAYKQLISALQSENNRLTDTVNRLLSNSNNNGIVDKDAEPTRQLPEDRVEKTTSSGNNHVQDSSRHSSTSSPSIIQNSTAAATSIANSNNLHNKIYIPRPPSASSSISSISSPASLTDSTQYHVNLNLNNESQPTFSYPAFKSDPTAAAPASSSVTAGADNFCPLYQFNPSPDVLTAAAMQQHQQQYPQSFSSPALPQQYQAPPQQPQQLLHQREQPRNIRNSNPSPVMPSQLDFVSSRSSSTASNSTNIPASPQQPISLLPISYEPCSLFFNNNNASCSPPPHPTMATNFVEEFVSF